MASPKQKKASTTLYSDVAAIGELPEKCGEEILRGSCRSRDEFISGDFCSNAHGSVPGGLSPHNLSLAADIYITRLGDLLRKGNHEFDFAANFEIGVSDKVQAAVTDVARVPVQFASFGPPCNPHHNTPRTSPRFAPLLPSPHQSP